MEEFLLIIILIFGGQILGSLIGVIKRPGNLFLRSSLAFAAAMMIGISFLELIPKALENITYYWVLFGFVFGGLVMLIVDRLLPHINLGLGKKEKPDIEKSVNMLVIGIALHNLPEGLAIGIGFVISPALGILIAIGIAVQDIPENLATVVSLYGLTGKRLKSMGILVGTVIFELAGFLLGYFILKDMPVLMLGISLAVASGFMVYISVEEIMPSVKIDQNPYAISASMLLGLMGVLATILIF